MSRSAGHRPSVVLGVAGGSLDEGASWAANAETVKAGARGEAATGRLLDRFAKAYPGVAVIHDLRVPNSGYTANIDHVIVSGNAVTVLDSKLWRPGFYWTFRGRTFRGLKRFSPAEKKFMVTVPDDVERYCARAGVSVRVRRPALWLVWPSNTSSRLLFFAASVPGTRVVDASSMTVGRLRRFAGSRRADPRVVAALASLRL